LLLQLPISSQPGLEEPSQRALAEMIRDINDKKKDGFISAMV
jgi:hypothetical protein